MQRACRSKWMKGWLALIIGLAAALSGLGAHSVSAAGQLELYTPYVKLSAPPGESLSYSIELLNGSGSTETVDVAFERGNHSWDYELTSGGRAVGRLAVKGGESQELNLRLDVPLEVEKGSYSFRVKAGEAVLPLVVDVSEKGTFRTELTTDQPNMQGHADSTFSFTAKLRNRTAEKQTYALAAQADPGWSVTFTEGGTSVTSVEVEPNAEKSITIAAKPPEMAEAGSYRIPIAATNNATSAQAELEAVITGSYDMSLSTPDERLNLDITAGSERKLDLIIANSGTAELKDVSMRGDQPSGWEVTFEPSTIDVIAPGQTARVQATVKSNRESLPGDYVLGITAHTAEKSANAQFRATVKASVLWGWIGIAIIAAVAGGIYYLFRRYGRR